MRQKLVEIPADTGDPAGGVEQPENYLYPMRRYRPALQLRTHYARRGVWNRMVCIRASRIING